MSGVWARSCVKRLLKGTRRDPKAEITEENARLIVKLGEKLVKEVEKRIFKSFDDE